MSLDMTKVNPEYVIYQAIPALKAMDFRHVIR